MNRHGHKPTIPRICKTELIAIKLNVLQYFSLELALRGIVKYSHPIILTDNFNQGTEKSKNTKISTILYIYIS